MKWSIKRGSNFIFDVREERKISAIQMLVLQFAALWTFRNAILYLHIWKACEGLASWRKTSSPLVFFHIRIWQVFGTIWRTAFYFRICLTLTISFWDYLIPMSFLEGVVHFVVACNCVNKKLKMLSTTPIKKEWVKCKWINREAKEKLTFIRNSNSCRSANGFGKNQPWNV